MVISLKSWHSYRILGVKITDSEAVLFEKLNPSVQCLHLLATQGMWILIGSRCGLGQDLLCWEFESEPIDIKKFGTRLSIQSKAFSAKWEKMWLIAIFHQKVGQNWAVHSPGQV